MKLPNPVFQRELYFVEDGIHTPGHTPDSISVLDEADGVLMLADNIGDSLDEIVPSIGCDVGIYLNTLKQYGKMRFDTCISGHNCVLEKEVIQTVLNTKANGMIVHCCTQSLLSVCPELKNML